MIEIPKGSFWECKAFSKKRGYGDTGRVKIYEVSMKIVKTRSLTNPSRPHYGLEHFLENYRRLEVDLFGDIIDEL